FAAAASGGYPRKRSGLQQVKAAKSFAAKGEAYSEAVRRRQRPRCASGHALRANRIVSGDDGRAACCREGSQGRSYARGRWVPVNRSRGRLDAGDQWFAVEELADGDRRIEGAGISVAPSLCAQIGIEVCGRRNATGEIPLAR